jgi:pimeloyl-ACP methyl ester carboxylesterase
VRGGLADSGWSDVDPRKHDVLIAVQASTVNGCCTVGQQSWQKTFQGHFGFFDQQRSICPPLACASLTVRRTGSVGFKITTPGVDVRETTLPEISIGVLIGSHCSASAAISKPRRTFDSSAVGPAPPNGFIPQRSQQPQYNVLDRPSAGLVSSAHALALPGTGRNPRRAPRSTFAARTASATVAVIPTPRGDTRMRTQQQTPTRFGVIAAATLAFAGASPAPAHALRPIVFVHGGSGSGAQYETQAMRFASNGYPPGYVRVHEYDSTFSINTQEQVLAGLDVLIDQLLAETGADKIDLLGHSLGTVLMQLYLSSPERAARVAHYVNIDGAPAAAPPGGVPTLAIWGMGSPTRQIVGAENVYFPDQTHVQVATSAESFAAQFGFFTGAPPATTDILPEPRVQLAGRTVLFPQNTGVPGASLQIFEVDGATGSRSRADPDAVYPLTGGSARGAFGPFEATSGRHYEFLVLRQGGRPQHFYPQPGVRSDYLIRLLTVPSGSILETNADSSDDTSGFVLTRYREFWGDQGPNSDMLTVNGLNIISPTNCPINKRVNAMFVFDDNLDGMNNLVTPNPFYFALPFITAMDVFIPGADPPNGVVHIQNTSRGGLTAAINVPNWASSHDVMSIILNPNLQPSSLQQPPNKQQLKCETGTSQSLAKFVKAKGKCIQKCLDTQRKQSGPYTDCSAPYGGATATCIRDAKKGAEPKARDSIEKACEKDCPACYDAGGNCPDGANFVAAVEDSVDGTGPLAYCLEAAGMTPTKTQAKCEDGVAKSLIEFTGAKSKCYDTCVDKEFKGKIPAGSCTTGSPSDGDTQDCIQKAQDKAAAAIDKVCEKADAKPSCYPPARDSGAEWAAVVENLVDTRTPLVYCSSASTTTTITIVTSTTTTLATTTTTTTTTSTTTTTIYGSPSRAFLVPGRDLLE